MDKLNFIEKTLDKYAVMAYDKIMASLHKIQHSNSDEKLSFFCNTRQIIFSQFLTTRGWDFLF